jgi:hypothetical protein
MQKTLNLRLPVSTPKQKEIEDCPAKGKVVLAGRRFGKTTLFAKNAVGWLLRGEKTIEAAPVTKQTTAFWRKCKHYLAPLIEDGVCRKWETERILEMGSGYIQAQTAHDEDTLRGDWTNHLLLDEYAYMKPGAWEVVGAPMLLDADGDVMFAFTPNHRNHAFLLYQQALADETGYWQTFHGTSYDNPRLKPYVIDRLKASMTEQMIRQEIYAEFLEGEGAVFRNINACMTAPQTTPEQHNGHYIVAGVDWAKQSDYTCISIGCATCHIELERDRFNKIDYVFQRKRLEQLLKTWSVRHALVELNSIGEPNFEELSRAGFPVGGFSTTAQSKPPLIENLALTFEAEEWRFQPDPIWTGELEAYERKVNAVTGRSSYSAPEGMHDDTVMARALMVWAARNRATVIENPFDM